MTRESIVFAILVVFAALPALSFAEECPAGAGDCFLCGGIGGIPCSSSDSCPGQYDTAVGDYIACACPQDEPCTCYCPYEQYGAQSATGGQQATKPGCPQGCIDCSADGSVCVTAQIQQVQGSGTVTVSPSGDAEIFVRRSGGGWARVTSPITIDEDYEVKTIGDPQQIAGRIEYNDYYGKYTGTTYLQTGAYIHLQEAPQVIEEPGVPLNMETVRITIELFKGALFTDIVPKPVTKFEYHTSVSVTGVKGTKFYLEHDEATNTDIVKTYEGVVEVTSNSGTVEVPANQMVTVTSSGHSAPQEFDPSQDEVPWGGGCCGSAFILGFAALGAFALRLQKE